MSSRARALVVQWEVVTALVLRETLTRYGDSSIGYIWALIRPMLTIGVFLMMAYLGRTREMAGMDLVGFFTTGLIAYDMVTFNLNQAANASKANRALLAYPRVRPVDTVIARVYLESATLVVVFAILMGLNAVYLGELHVESWRGLLGAFGLGMWLGGSAGLVVCGLGTIWGTFHRVVDVMMRPLLFFSGVFYPGNALPPMIRDVLMYNPVLHVVELLRSAWFRGYESQFASPTYVAGWCVVLSVLGLMTERFARDQAED